MTSLPDDGLLASLKRLYQRVFSRYLEQRQATYHPSGAAEPGSAIADRLQRRIEGLADVGQRATAGPAPRPDAAQKPKAQANEWVAVEHGVANDLSQYFEEHHDGSSLLPDAGKRLMQSTWEHIHAALRCARQGDTRQAELHAGIANNAFKEAARYLPEKDYAAFAAEVGDLLEGSERPAES